MDLIPAHRPHELQVILRTRDHAALYDPSSNSLPPIEDAGHADRFDRDTPAYIAPNYFRLLAQASSVPGNGTDTRPPSPPLGHRRFVDSGDSSRCATPEIDAGYTSPRGSGASASGSQPLGPGTEADGYYARFFVEIKKLGRGARGTVFLCQHVLNGNKLGRYAIKKIPVGDHAESLLKSLNEVHLMESLHHPHLIHYQHAWIESCQVSAFAPRVPTLHVLMMAANGGSLADWVSARSGEAANASPRPSNANSPAASGRGATAGGESSNRSSAQPSRARLEKLKAAVRQRRAQREAAQVGGDQRSAAAIGANTVLPASFASGVDSGVGVHLLRDDEIYSLMHDMTSGLGFLHDRGILHLDIKPGNVLLHWDDDALIPRAMLSDFGSSMLLHDNWTRQRSGHTGTMEYMSPETLTTDPSTGKLSELSSKADIWSLGMILHLLLFFHLPYSQVDDVDRLRDEMLAYRGFNRASMSSQGTALRRQRPAKLIRLLERLLNLDPAKRPNCHEILQILASGPEPADENAQDAAAELLALYRRRSPFEEWSPSSPTESGGDRVGAPAAPVSRLPRRLSLGPGPEGVSSRSGSGLMLRRIRQRGAQSQLGDAIADAIWIATGIELDPIFVRILLAVVLCVGKCLSLDLVCFRHGERAAVATWYPVFTLALSDVAVSAISKPYSLDLAITSTLLSLHIALLLSARSVLCVTV
ncbi:related to IKS1 - putative serine/threonine kinase [Pseudozyma flocculosa]|uniref:non-specific serine/threonine protein kinase n=1 Tax=Pseudozyma flocculosa TaxID=84751 RepID=A0A5C3F0B2_9BASI|nr:related to IKS1 - putative serine/threonine kinase [Pseudozyma flocculosa]